VKAGQQARAKVLLGCLSKLGLVTAPFLDARLDDPTLFPKLDALAKTLAADPSDGAAATLDARTCFSWARAALQRHKGEPGWSYLHALDASTLPETTFAATEMLYDKGAAAGSQRACTGSPAP
jgi:hypothetical protein